MISGIKSVINLPVVMLKFFYKKHICVSIKKVYLVPLFLDSVFWYQEIIIKHI